MEKQFQTVYTISKFKEIQAEFVGKVYCDLISSSEGCFGTTYEVREDLFCGHQRKKKSFFVSFNRDKCEVVCSCHLFEFRGILCRHSIAVLIRNDVSRLPDRYILHRWRKDIRRPYTRIALKYDGLRNSPGQLRYDNLCTAFAKVAGLAADDEVRAGLIMEWIQLQAQELSMLKHIGEKNIDNDPASFKTPCSIGVGDPKLTKRKGAPRKVRKKSPLESTSNKKKKKNEAPSTNRGKRLTKELIKQTNEPKILALETGADIEVENQPSMELLTERTNFTFDTQGHVIQYYNQYSPYQMGDGS
ncbi:FAR1-related protein, partial [Striga asiatica]